MAAQEQRVTYISVSLLIWGMLEASHPQNHEEVWTGRDRGTFLLHPPAQSISNSESLIRHSGALPGQIWRWRCHSLSRHPVLVLNHSYEQKFFQLAFPLPQFVTYCLLSFFSSWQHSGDTHTMAQELSTQQALRQNHSITLGIELNEGCCNPTLSSPSFTDLPSIHIREQNPEK